ncbi:hypothetical protein COT44_00195 [Candidatus Shapirobacteria bacterium CG08_land_8_20_14_0_20_39_18]|uniref:Uncharacterized protein n=1 Tax=Candidatus Shapirobacteria bacterium CG08_land_8_20_14_0_20_39_18 TaxID=1974883 RepID=A0A2M6XE50_9BACT|nr:MAG: hypothetical protein COT44_00195 [Candidatus Shapirobacteria bacterium CG08_land_8_20_14_0_20_39_18]PIY64688.1 MAG: hypothetical protein COY91_04435 [Candidatus Shapirobacteria bacterium CG_4_10_14_0_8_um_filter_39_15]PJE68140.1 MAG: hypothetical protein COU94_03460 [Candidatus Shapirobacteria bacterium CG10_big_fil_rev_8_21_14_0_10_38_8]
MDDQNPTVTAVSPEEINQQVGDLITLESKVKREISMIDGLKKDLKTQKEMFDDIFQNDETYRTQDQTVKEATKIRGGTKLQLLKQQSTAELDEKIKDIKLQLNELQQTLSVDLLEYQKTTGATQIETENGQTLQIVLSSKLVRA